jgi:competence protein ComEC
LPYVWVIIAGLFLITAIKRKRPLVFAAAILFGLSFGWWRGANFARKLTPYENLYGREVIIRATATNDGVYENGQLTFDVGKMEFIEPLHLTPPGILKVQLLGVPAVSRNDQLEIAGVLYPSGGSRQGRISYGSGKVVARRKNWVENLRRKFVAGMQTALPEPHASFGLGILVGQRNTLPEDVTKQLSIVGLTHIIAVSGYNLTIIIDFVRQKLGKGSKYQTLMMSLFLIAGFLLITGFSASIVRAAIVSSLSLGAWYYGRKIRPLLILLLSGAITAGWYPIYIWSDIGWYLSFLAFFGVLILAPLLTKRFWKKRPWGIMPIVIESGCAQIMTAPYVMYIFKETSLIALPSNMLIVPMVPFAMFFVFIAGLAGMLVSRVAGWLAWPAHALLGYMLELTRLLSRIPKAHVKVSLPLSVMLILYAIVTLLSWRLWLKTKPKRGILSDTNNE